MPKTSNNVTIQVPVNVLSKMTIAVGAAMDDHDTNNEKDFKDLYWIFCQLLDAIKQNA